MNIRQVRKMNLKKLRTDRKLTISQLSQLSGVPTRTIEDIESKDVNFKIQTAIKLADALSVSLDELCR
jgi:transcriptional regulator with XRE-family HTH domain